jgi:catechol 2,3-dioxygenase-like lactoylglutathione lyase family enzyme
MSLTDASVEGRLPARDLDRARRWYAEKLGLEPAEERPGGLRYVLASGVVCLFAAQGGSEGLFTQLALYVADLDAEMAAMRARGVVFEEYEVPGLTTVDGVADVEGNYPSKGRGERAAWFRDSEGNLIGMAELLR